MDEKTLTPEEKQLLKIAQLKAKLQKEQAKLQTSQRKERNGQLIVFGVMVEELYKIATPEQRESWKNKAEQTLTGRNLERAWAGFARLDQDENL